MRVSVSLHFDAPPEDGNQRDFEGSYQNYNRRVVEMDIDQHGAGTCEFEGLEFPAVGNMDDREPRVLTHFSLGVCIAPADKGGAIIIVGPLHPPVYLDPGVKPQVSAAVGVYAARLAAMRRDGRLVDGVKPDPARGINL